jgi:hypothetical protein
VSRGANLGRLARLSRMEKPRQSLEVMRRELAALEVQFPS